MSVRYIPLVRTLGTSWFALGVSLGWGVGAKETLVRVNELHISCTALTLNCYLICHEDLEFHTSTLATFFSFSISK